MSSTPDSLSALETAELRRRTLASAAKRLRVAVMTDPACAPELADTLIELVGNRLLVWAFAEAAADAPDSVVQSARILAAGGPVGPYADAQDAGRYLAASLQLAAVQAGLGQPEAAGRTLEALDGWRAQLGRLPVVEQLPLVTVVWALTTRARARLAQDVGQANAYADAALLRLHAAGLDLEPGHGHLVIAVHLAAADARWAAGHPEAALAHHRLAVDRHRALTGDLGAVSRPAVVQAVLAPVAELYQPYALRLEAIGERALALTVRREWLGLQERLADDASGAALARESLRAALDRAGREIEAAELEPAVRPRPTPAAPMPLPSLPRERIEWSPLPAEKMLASGGLSVTASLRVQRDEQAAVEAGMAARAVAERDEARRQAQAEQAAAIAAAELAEVERRASAEAEAAAQAAAERERAEAARAAARQQAQREAERAAAEARRRDRAAARQARRAVDTEVLRAAKDELPDVRRQVQAAGDDPASLAVAQERLVELLRPLALASPDQYRDELATTLDTLVRLRWRLGDPAGSRDAARERKAL